VDVHRHDGREGLTAATETAILNANYIARRLSPHFPVLYTGHDGLVAHECIIDLRPLQDATGISERRRGQAPDGLRLPRPDHVFPVPGTLMIEPTESESKAETGPLHRRHDRDPRRDRQSGKRRIRQAGQPAEVRTAHCGSADRRRWDRKYSREVAAYPVPSLRKQKYWPPVGRADNVYGDRNLFCAARR
jgi:glycine dehydrogenase